MRHYLHTTGDFLHFSSMVTFLFIVKYRGNANGVSLQSQFLYLVVFCLRYTNLFVNFGSWYLFLLRITYISMTAATVYVMRRVEPAKSTYSPAQDALGSTNFLVASAIFALMVHLIGNGVVDIKGSSGEQFEVHLDQYSTLSYFFTWSICLEPFAMLPQLYIFRNNRRISREVRLAIAFRGLYRICYVCGWISLIASEQMDAHHLLHFSGFLQCVTYFDFWYYHLSVGLLWFLLNVGGADSRNMMEESGVGAFARTHGLHRQDPAASAAEGEDDEIQDLMQPIDAGWGSGRDKPIKRQLQMGKIGRIGII